MSRFFNTAGPIVREDHYFIEPLNRIDLDEILKLIDQKKYFVLHAPRQTGKTSYLLALMDFLNRQGKFKTLYTNIESAQAARENVKEGMQVIMSTLADDAFHRLNDSFLEEKWQEVFEQRGGFSAFGRLLTLWCQKSEKPVVLFIDEVDSLVGDTLISLLRQLRSGYANRSALFPQSIILCGVRDVFGDCFWGQTNLFLLPWIVWPGTNVTRMSLESMRFKENGIFNCQLTMS